MRRFVSAINVFFICALAIAFNSCRPPNYAEDAMNRGMRMEGGEVYSDKPGQGNPGIRVTYVWDPRPDVVKNADNPDYDPTGGLLGRMWDGIRNGFSTGDASSPDVTNFQPEPISAEIDNYDIKSGKVKIPIETSTENDPEVEEMRRRQKEFDEEIQRKHQLKEQRDYLEAKANSDVQRFMGTKVEGVSGALLKQTEDLKKEIDAAIVEHNKAVDQMIYDEVGDLGENSTPSGYVFRSAPNTVNGQRVRSVQYSIDSARKSVSQMSGDAKARGETMLNLAQNAVVAADKSYVSGNQAGGDFATELATTAVDVGLSLIPGVGLAKDAIEAATGYSVVTGKKLSGFERTMAVVGVLTVGYGSALKYAGKAAILADVLKAGKAAEEGAEIARATAKATEIAESAAKAGIKEKGIIDELADAVKEGMPCKIGFQSGRGFFDKLLFLIEDRAFAADCLPGSAEDALKSAIEGSADVANVRWGMWTDLPKANYKGREYAQIGERYYTQHAIDRMTPAGFGTAAGGSAGRGVPTTVVEYTLDQGRKIAEETVAGVARETWKMGTVQVITEESKKVVITVMRVAE